MTEVTPTVSEYLSDQHKRYGLLDIIVTVYDDVSDFGVLLLALAHGGLNHEEYVSTTRRARILAMNLQDDWVALAPILFDIYNDEADDVAITICSDKS